MLKIQSKGCANINHDNCCNSKKLEYYPVEVKVPEKGDNGKSAYQLALETGEIPSYWTLEDYLDSLHGTPGTNASAFTYVMSIFEELQAISYAVLRVYIHENDRDGKWDLTP